MRQVIQVEWQKLIRWRLFRATVVLGSALSLLWLGVAIYFFQKSGSFEIREEFLRRLTLPGVVPQGLSLAAGFGESFFAIVAAAFMAQEFSWGTWRLLLPTGVPRWQLILGKVVALWLGTWPFTFFTVLPPVLALPLVASSFDVPLTTDPFPRLWLVEWALLLLRATIALLAPALFAMVLATITRSQAIAVGVTIGWSFIEGIVTPPLTGTTRLVGSTSTLPLSLKCPSLRASAHLQRSKCLWTPITRACSTTDSCVVPVLFHHHDLVVWTTRYRDPCGLLTCHRVSSGKTMETQGGSHTPH